MRLFLPPTTQSLNRGKICSWRQCGKSWASLDPNRWKKCWARHFVQANRSSRSCYSRYKWYINLCKWSKQQPTTFSTYSSPSPPTKPTNNPTAPTTSKPSPKSPTIAVNNAPFWPKSYETHPKNQIFSCPNTNTSATWCCDPVSRNIPKTRPPPIWTNSLSSATSRQNLTKSLTASW